MKSTVLRHLGCLSLLLLSRAFAQGLTPPDHLRPDIAAGEAAAAARLMEVTASPLTDRYDLKYHRLEWQVDPAVNFIRGAVTSYYLPTVAGMDSLYFDLDDTLTVDSVRYHGQSVPFAQLPSELLRITLPGATPVGGLDSVTVWYHGVPDGSGFGSFVQSMHDSVPVIWTLSEPYGARDWWPCKDGITDKIDSIDVYVTAPDSNKVAGNGVLLSVTPVPGGHMHHWRHRYPIATYLIAFAVTNYAEFSNWVVTGNDSLEVLNYVFPEDLGGFSWLGPEIVPVIELYDSLFGMYPFQNEKYGHAQFGWGGGMEHQTMSFVSSPDFELRAHELAHQWFGDKVTCGSWSDIWLNEGWATYCSGLCYENGLGTLPWMDFKRNRIDHVISAPDGSVYCNDTTSVGRIFNGRLSYSKGAMILHQLRWVIGDSAFFAATRAYMSAPSLAYGFATTDDFKQKMEAASGRNLTQYFTDWYYGEGYPSYEVYWDWANDSAYFQINQSASFPGSVPFFALPLPIKLSDGTRDTLVILDHTSNGQTFSLPVPFQFTSIEFDPERWLITGTPTLVAAVEPSEPEVRVSMWPNPAHDFLNLNGERMQQVSLMDMQGRVLWAQELRENVRLQRVELPAVASGLYVVTVKTAHGTRTQKLQLR